MYAYKQPFKTYTVSLDQGERKYLFQKLKISFERHFFIFYFDSLFICHAKDWLLENTGLFISWAILSKQLNVLKLVQLINTASEDVF